MRTIGFLILFVSLIACLLATPPATPACNDVAVASVAIPQVQFVQPFFAVQSYAVAQPVFAQPAFTFAATPVFVQPAFVPSAVVVNHGFAVRSRGFARVRIGGGAIASAQAVAGGGFFRQRAVARVRPALFGGSVAVSRVRTR